MPYSKYHARKITTPEGSFDSRKAYRRWKELCLLPRGGAISDLRRQITYPLIPEQREPDTTGSRGGVRRGKLLERPVEYVADFVYAKDGQTVVEDRITSSSGNLCSGCMESAYWRREVRSWSAGHSLPFIRALRMP